jgi:hypothetical protein
LPQSVALAGSRLSQSLALADTCPPLRGSHESAASTRRSGRRRSRPTPRGRALKPRKRAGRADGERRTRTADTSIFRRTETGPEYPDLQGFCISWCPADTLSYGWFTGGFGPRMSVVVQNSEAQFYRRARRRRASKVPTLCAVGRSTWPAPCGPLKESRLPSSASARPMGPAQLRLAAGYAA